MPSYLDLGLIVVVLISALLSMLRGFTREVLAIASWAAAAVGRRLSSTRCAALCEALHLTRTPIALGGLGGRRLLRHPDHRLAHHGQISDAILDSQVGALDRSLGFVFGAARGFLLVRHRLHVLQLAGAGEDRSRNGCKTAQARGRCCRRPAISSWRCCPTTRKHHREA